MANTNDNFELPYLDMLIVNSGNNDGYVLLDPDEGINKHCGNFSNDDDGLLLAKKTALVHCWIKHPQLRHLIVRRALRASGTHLEYSAFKSFMDKRGVSLPIEITCSQGPNRSILFAGKPFLTEIPGKQQSHAYTAKLIDLDKVSQDHVVIDECDSLDLAIYKAKVYAFDHDLDSSQFAIMIEESGPTGTKEVFNTFDSVEQRFLVFDL